jgi:hypothetical protein
MVLCIAVALHERRCQRDHHRQKHELLANGLIVETIEDNRWHDSRSPRQRTARGRDQGALSLEVIGPQRNYALTRWRRWSKRFLGQCPYWGKHPRASRGRDRELGDRQPSIHELNDPRVSEKRCLRSMPRPLLPPSERSGSFRKPWRISCQRRRILALQAAGRLGSLLLRATSEHVTTSLN